MNDTMCQPLLTKLGDGIREAIRTWDGYRRAAAICVLFQPSHNIVLFRLSPISSYVFHLSSVQRFYYPLSDFLLSPGRVLRRSIEVSPTLREAAPV